MENITYLFRFHPIEDVLNMSLEARFIKIQELFDMRCMCIEPFIHINSVGYFPFLEGFSEIVLVLGMNRIYQ